MLELDQNEDKESKFFPPIINFLERVAAEEEMRAWVDEYLEEI